MHCYRGKKITAVENYILVADPLLAHCMGPLSSVYEVFRTVNGQIFAKAGWAVYSFLAWWNGDNDKVCVLCNGVCRSLVECMLCSSHGLSDNAALTLIGIN